jgi:2-C-methyl-D-erythritol 4-phosphate cytidylyltransferase / 2-C-methyl-D-erythritol 2,4-cyclodiphosphate synthase
MGKTAAIIVAAGSGSRAGDSVPKQFRILQGKPMLRHSAEAFAEHPAIDAIIVVVGNGQVESARQALPGLDVKFVTGGSTRRESVHNGIQAIDAAAGFSNILVHDAARPFLSAKVIDDLLAALDHHDGAVPALPVIDSLARSVDGATLSSSESRDGLWRIQTPQAFRHDVIFSAHRLWDVSREATDDARMAMAAGFDVALVAGDDRLAKYTFSSDFAEDADQLAVMQSYRTGMGYDVHRLVAGEELWLCGIKLEHPLGLSGHSDADVALHALTDAILGASALGDIGDHFPPSDPRWRGASSDLFLKHAAHIAGEKGFAIVHVDITIICETPKIGPHKHAMRARVGDILGLSVDDVSIKATTTEKLGYTGRGEGIAAHAVATLSRPERMKT